MEAPNRAEPIDEPQVPQAPELTNPQASADLESRIDALVAAALDKHLTPEPSSVDREVESAHEELARTRAELARALEDAEQARAEVRALTERVTQLEPPAQQLQPVPAPEQPAAPHDPELDDHLARAMRRLETGPRSSESF